MDSVKNIQIFEQTIKLIYIRIDISNWLKLWKHFQFYFKYPIVLDLYYTSFLISYKSVAVLQFL